MQKWIATINLSRSHPSANISDKWTEMQTKIHSMHSDGGWRLPDDNLVCDMCVAGYQYRRWLQRCCHVLGTDGLTTIPNICTHARHTYAIMIINANRFVFGAASHDAALLATPYCRRRSLVSLSALDADRLLIGCHMTITFHCRTLYFHHTLRREYS